MKIKASSYIIRDGKLGERLKEIAIVSLVIRLLIALVCFFLTIVIMRILATRDVSVPHHANKFVAW